MRAQDLHKMAGSEIIDYPFLMGALHEYTSPRAKVTQLIKAGELIRVKKGLYVLAEEGKPGPYSPEILANLIYGPSYMSLHYALGYYQLIPERVESITSITSNQKDKEFHTPLGRFTYRYQNPRIYSVGFIFVEQKATGFLIASPEKALADLLYYSKPEVKNAKELEEYLHEDLRLYLPALKKFSLARMKKIAAVMKRNAVSFLLELMR